MGQQELRILLIHDESEARNEVYELLRETDIGTFQIEYLNAQLDTVSRLTPGNYDICIIDSDRERLRLLKAGRFIAGHAPVIALTPDSATEVLRAMHHGASDCLIREDLTAAILEESICAVVEKARNLESQAEYERYYLGLVENSDQAIYAHDLQGNYTSINHAGEDLMGYTREEILAMNLGQTIAPECIGRVWQIIFGMLEDRRPARYEAVMVTKMGQRLTLGITNHLIYRDGTPIRVQGVVRELVWQNAKVSVLAECKSQVR